MTAVKRTDDVLVAFKEPPRQRRRRRCSAWSVTGRTAFSSSSGRTSSGSCVKVLFLGYQEEVASFYAAFDALVLPSGNEGTPVSVIEALAAERPVVATRVGGVPDVVRDGEDGFLVEAGETGDLADRLEQLARDPELRERMGQAGTRAGPTALRGRAPRRGRRRALSVAAQCGRRAKALNAGFFLPAAVRKPDCQPMPMFVSSRSMNQTIRSIRGLARAIA